MLKFFVLFSLYFITTISFAQYETLKSKVEKKCDLLSMKHGELEKKDRQFFIDLICSNYIQRIENDKIDQTTRFDIYLEEVLSQIKDQKDSNRLRLNKSPYANAFTQFLGDININWGILADLESEAGLAFLLGHELAHDKEDHIYKSFLGRKKSKDESMDDVINSYHEMQSNEYDSDRIAFRLGVKAGYNWEQGVDFFHEFQSLDSIFQYMDKKSSENEEDMVELNSDTIFSSHPTTLSRIKQWKKLSKEIETKKGSDFIVSKSEFENLKSYAVKKTLERFLKEYDYKLGLIKAFKYYSLDNKSADIHHYFYQFVTRKVMLEPDLLGKKFLSDIISNEDIKGSLRWIYRKETQREKGERLLNIIEQNGGTYADVINILEKRSLSISEEYYLSKAIYNNSDTLKKNISLRKYLSFNNIKYRQFAKSSLENKLRSSLIKEGKNFFLFNNVEGYYMYSKGVTSSPAITNERYHSLEEEYSSYFENGETEFISWSNNFFTKDDIRVISSYINLRADNSIPYQSWENNPELWTVFNRNKIKGIEILNVYEFQNRTINRFENFLINTGLFFRGLIPVYGVDNGREIGVKSVNKKRDNYYIEILCLKTNVNSSVRYQVIAKQNLTKNLFVTEILFLRKRLKRWRNYL